MSSIRGHKQFLLGPTNKSKCGIRKVPLGTQSVSNLSLVVGWICILVLGMSWLWQYEHAAGLVYESPSQWPEKCEITTLTGRPILLFFAHPKCPCTRASIGELARIMTVCKDKVEAFAIFVKPTECSQNADWEKSDLWTTAAEIPGVTVVCDVDGKEAKRFQAVTSGLAILYDRFGRSQFRGGITESRGHSGDNMGRSAIVSFLTLGWAELDKTKVFGCELGISITDPIPSCCLPETETK